jgi:hypothetical protein
MWLNNSRRTMIQLPDTVRFITYQKLKNHASAANDSLATEKTIDKPPE